MPFWCRILQHRWVSLASTDHTGARRRHLEHMDKGFISWQWWGQEGTPSVRADYRACHDSATTSYCFDYACRINTDLLKGILVRQRNSCSVVAQSPSANGKTNSHTSIHHISITGIPISTSHWLQWLQLSWVLEGMCVRSWLYTHMHMNVLVHSQAPTFLLLIARICTFKHVTLSIGWVHLCWFALVISQVNVRWFFVPCPPCQASELQREMENTQVMACPSQTGM